jgi:porphobilinogen synthase
MSKFPEVRLRRLRSTPALRRMLSLSLPGPEKFVWPVFVTDGQGVREPIEAMPGQNRISVDVLPDELARAADAGIGGVLLFGVADEKHKDATGSAAFADDGVIQQAVRNVRAALPEMLVFTDVCLCAYTSHGHCGPLDGQGNVENDAANAVLARVAVSHAAAGAHVVAPSAMMDGQVQAVRGALDTAGHAQTLVMSYSTKFASQMYGPFREAERSAPQSGDRRGYQAPFGDLRQALRESELDEQEGADILMVKPALFYTDVIARLRDRTDLPIAAYNVSGEYAMLIAAAERGWGDLSGMVRESITALARAGTDIIISYWAGRYNEIFGEE